MVGNTEVEKRIKNDIANELEFYGKLSRKFTFPALSPTNITI